MSFNLRYYNQNSTDPLYLFLHGFMGDGEDWISIIEQLGQKAITADLPGHGKNQRLNYQNLEQVASELLEKLPNQQMIVVGYSMGGRLALEMLYQHSSRFQSAIIESANPSCPNTQERLEHDSSLITAPFDRFIDDWFAQSLFGNLNQSPNFEELLKKRKKNNPIHLQQALTFLSVAKQRDLWDFLGRLDVPLTYITGELDQKYCEIGKKLQDLNKNIRHKLVTDAGHNVHFEYPDKFIKMIKGI